MSWGRLKVEWQIGHTTGVPEVPLTRTHARVHTHTHQTIGITKLLHLVVSFPFSSLHFTCMKTKPGVILYIDPFHVTRKYNVIIRIRNFGRQHTRKLLWYAYHVCCGWLF